MKRRQKKDYTDAFNIGKYFHFKSDRDADERMIINLYTQFEATELVHGLLYCANDYISRIKFFAVKQATPEKFLKCDKVVIYYDRQYRNHIYECVKTVADKGEIVFKKELSAFYHIAGDDEGKYPVGIGVELMASSFTENRAAEILEALTGVKFNKSDNKDRQHNIVSLPCEESFFDALYNNITSRLPAINH